MSCTSHRPTVAGTISRPSHRLALAGAIMLSFGLGACLDEESATLLAPEESVVHTNPGQPKAIEVYTRNMFLGGETAPLFQVDFAVLADPADPGFVAEFQKLLAAVNGFWAEVQQSDIPARAAEIVNDIDARRPHVASLQEAVGFVLLEAATMTPTLPQDFVAQDLLLSVQTEIARRGLPYELAVQRTTTQGALPIAIDPVTFQPTTLLGFTDRVVILKRTDVTTLASDHGLYQARIPLGPFDLVRGWARLSVEHEGEPHHVVATHLETQGSGAADPVRLVHNGQALELRNAVLAGLDGITILMGDLNSDAAADPSAPSWTPTYGDLTAAGFTDVWSMAPRRGTDTGFTCCFKDGRTLDERIDFVLTRTQSEVDRGNFRAEVVGDQPEDRTSDGLWPSDHAGISATIRLSDDEG